MIGKRLKMLRESKNMTRRQVAIDLQIPETTYRNYENEISEPNITMLIKFSTYYNIEVDWILGIEQKNSIPPQSRWDALKEIMENLPEQDVKELLEFAKFLEWRKDHQN